MPKRVSARDLADPASPYFTIERSPFFLLNRASATYALLMHQALARVGADVPRWRVLVLAEQRGPISVSAIADLAVIRLSTVTKVVQRLARDGLLAVRRSMPGRLLRALTDGRLEWASLGPVYDAFHFPGGFELDFPDNPEQFRENLVRAFPRQGEAISRYLGLVKESYEEVRNRISQYVQNKLGAL